MYLKDAATSISLQADSVLMLQEQPRATQFEAAAANHLALLPD